MLSRRPCVVLANIEYACFVSSHVIVCFFETWYFHELAENSPMHLILSI
jgi:hypothetical protein